MSAQVPFRGYGRPRTEPAATGLPDDVELRCSELGGKAVYHRGEFIGWMHEQLDRRWWNAYQRTGGVEGNPLGTFEHDEAVRRIVAAHVARAAAEERRERLCQSTPDRWLRG